METKLVVFQDKEIRRVLYRGEWYFSVIDVVEVLTGSSIPKRYWSDLKKKLVSEGFAEAYEKIVRLKMSASDGKLRETDCASTETMFRETGDKVATPENYLDAPESRKRLTRKRS